MSKPTSKNPYGFWKTILLLIVAGTAALMISPVSADTGVTIAAQGDRSYYLGEKVVFSGSNSDSDTTYLFMTGPQTFVNGPGIPGSGGKLTSPQQEVVSGNPGSFTLVKTKPDKTWEYTWYTANLTLDAGTYTVYAASQPKAEDQLGSGGAGVGIIVKKPFIATAISPLPVQRGEPFTITGYAEGNPPAVQLWILGKTFFSLVTVPVDYEANYTFAADSQFSGKLIAGDYYLIAEHSMADNRFDIAFNGEYVTAMQDNDNTILFKVTGPGNLQGRDAADALVSALSENEHRNETYARDTHTIVAFTVGET
jgi:hypothetical protein